MLDLSAFKNKKPIITSGKLDLSAFGSFKEQFQKYGEYKTPSGMMSGLIPKEKPKQLGELYHYPDWKPKTEAEKKMQELGFAPPIDKKDIYSQLPGAYLSQAGRAITEETIQQRMMRQEKDKERYLIERGEIKNIVIDRHVANFVVGIGGTVEGMLGAAEWISPNIMKPFFEEKGDQIELWQKKTIPEDRKFIDDLVMGAGSVAAFFIPGIGAGKAALTIAGVSPKLALLFGNVVATALESATEAGSVYREKRNMGADEKESSWAATKTFVANSFLIGLTNKFGAFSDTTNSIIKRIALSAPMEGIQEYWQEVIQNVNTGKPAFQNALRSGIIGTILGIPTGGISGISFGNLSTTEQQRVVERIILEKAKKIIPPIGLTIEDITKGVPVEKKPIVSTEELVAAIPKPKQILPTKTIIRKTTGQIKPAGLREFTQRIKDLARGAREGTIATKQQIKATQTELLDILDKSNLELVDKAKFSKAIKNIQTQKQLQKVLPTIQERIIELEEASLKRSIVTQINKELKYTKPVREGQRKVGKYNYESNKLFTNLRFYNKLSQEKALNKLNEIPTEELSEMDKITTRLLSYKVNGVKSSLVLQEQVLADIVEMKRMGQEAKDEADFTKKLEKQKKIEEVFSGIEKQKKSIRFLKGAKTAYVSSVANLYSTLNAIAGKEIADKYDYAFYQTNSQSDFSAKIESVKEKTKEIYGVEKDRELNRIFLDELAPTDFTITDEKGFSEDVNKFNLMNIYNGVKNDLIKERYYKHFGEEQITSLLQNLSFEDVKLADYLMEEVQGYREILNTRSIEIFGRDLGTVENYWPAKSERQAEFFDDIKIQGEIPSAMKERSRSSKLVPEMANAWLVFQRHIAQAEHIKTLSPKYEELKRIFSDGQIKKTIQNKYGDKAYFALMDHIETFSLNKKIQILDVFSGGYNIALNNWVKAKIASPTVFTRQMISAIYSVEVVGIKNFVKYQKEAVQHPEKMFDFMWNNVPFIKARFKRGYSEALQDVIRGTNNLKIGISGITKYTTLMVRSGDIGAIIINGYPIIKTELAKGKSMEQAIETFQKFTEKTQQSGTLANLSSLQRQRNAFARTFLRFKNTTNQLLRLQTDANIQFINKQISAKEFAEKTMLYSVYTPIMYVLIGYMITQGFKRLFGKEDEEKTKSLPGDILQQVIVQPFQAIPLLDAAAETAYSEIRKRTTGKTYYYGEGLFSYPLLDDVSTAFSKLTKKEPTAEDFLGVISLIQEPITGIPTETILRYVEYAKGKEESAALPALPTLPSLPALPALPALPTF